MSIQSSSNIPIDVLPKRRFWISLEQPPETLPITVLIKDAFTVGHIGKVLRLKTGDSVLAIDDIRGVGYFATLQAVEKQAVSITLESVAPSPLRSLQTVILAAGLIKESHWDWMLQKATELGVTAIIPLKSAYSDIQDRMVKPDRWQQIIKAAALQSERFSLPIIQPLTSITDLNALLPAGCHKLLLQEREQNVPNLSEWLQSECVQSNHFSQNKPILLTIGPEGGWRPDEISALIQQGFQPVSLGPQILRAETAALAALSLVLCTPIPQPKE